MGALILSGRLSIHHCAMRDVDLVAGRSASAGTIIDNDPQIVAVRQMSE
jgi:hypothetical protein